MSVEIESNVFVDDGQYQTQEGFVSYLENNFLVA